MKTNLQSLRKGAGFRSARAFADHMDLSVNTYTGYEQGKTNLTLEQAWLFADALGEAMGRFVTLDELAGRKAPPDEASLSPEERTLVDAYRRSDERGQGNILFAAEREKTASAPDVVRDDRRVG